MPNKKNEKKELATDFTDYAVFCHKGIEGKKFIRLSGKQEVDIRRTGEQGRRGISNIEQGMSNDEGKGEKVYQVIRQTGSGYQGNRSYK